MVTIFPVESPCVCKWDSNSRKHVACKRQLYAQVILSRSEDQSFTSKSADCSSFYYEIKYRQNNVHFNFVMSPYLTVFQVINPFMNSHGLNRVRLGRVHKINLTIYVFRTQASDLTHERIQLELASIEKMHSLLAIGASTAYQTFELF